MSQDLLTRSDVLWLIALFFFFLIGFWLFRTMRRRSPVSDKPETDVQDMPTMNLLLTVMKKEGELFSAEDIQKIAVDHVLQLSEEGVFELISPNTHEVMLYVFNVRRPGSFPKEWDDFQGTDGLMLFIPLPHNQYPEESLTLLHAAAYEIARKYHAIVCDGERKALTKEAELKMAQDVRCFSQRYAQWLQENRS